MKRFLLLVLAGLIASIPLFAHHGNAAFDAGKRLTLSGMVTDWFWANPHCVLSFDVKDEQGQVVHWLAEASNPPDMVNRGWNKASLKAGDQITIVLEPVKNGRPIGRLIQVVLANGQKLSGGFGSLDGSLQAAPNTAPKSSGSN